MDLSNGKMYELIEFLQYELTVGNRWVAFQGRGLPGETFLMKGFESSLTAENFCANHLFEKDPEDDSLIDLDYRYHCISNLIAEYNALISGSKSPIATLDELRDFLQSSGITPMYEDYSRRILSELASGRVIAAQRNLSIIPANVAASYKIVAHRHEQRGQIYELGHSTKILASFDNLPLARQAFELHAGNLKPDGRLVTELILICAFKDTTLNLDSEGRPMYNSGVAIAQAGYVNDDLKVTDMLDPYIETKVQQRFFVQLNKEKRELIVLDDKLGKVDLPPAGMSYWEWGYTSVFHDDMLLSQTEKQLPVIDQHNETVVNLDKLVGKTVAVHPDLDTDPVRMQGEIGKVIKVTGDVVTVQFRDGISAKYQDDGLIILKPARLLLEELLRQFGSIGEEQKRKTLEVIKLLGEGKRLEALELVLPSDQLVSSCTMKPEDYVTNKAATRNIKHNRL